MIYKKVKYIQKPIQLKSKRWKRVVTSEFYRKNCKNCDFKCGHNSSTFYKHEIVYCLKEECESLAG